MARSRLPRQPGAQARRLRVREEGRPHIAEGTPAGWRETRRRRTLWRGPREVRDGRTEGAEATGTAPEAANGVVEDTGSARVGNGTPTARDGAADSAVGLPGAVADEWGEGQSMRDDGMREERGQPDEMSDAEHSALSESQARIRRTLDAAVSRETANPEPAGVPKQRWTEGQDLEAGQPGYEEPATGPQLQVGEGVPGHAAGGWQPAPAGQPAIGRATVVAAYQDPAGSHGSASATGGDYPGVYSEPYTDVVSRETPPVEDEPPLAMEARRAMAVLNPSGEATLPRPSKLRVMCIANQKGGVGKTTTAVNIAVSLALHGNRVLVIDLDPQGNASTGLGVEHHTGTPSVYECLLDEIKLSDVAKPVEGIPNLACAPATIDLAGAEIELVSIVARESRLSRAIEAYEGELDYVFIDCPPSLGLLTVNALVAAEEVLIPIQCEYYALEGLGQLLRNIELVKAHLNPRLRVSTILLTMYDRRTKLADQVEQEVRSHFGDVVLETVIPRSVRVSEAPGYGQSVMTYDPGSRGATSYFGAAQEIAVRGVNPGEN